MPGCGNVPPGGELVCTKLTVTLAEVYEDPEGEMETDVCRQKLVLRFPLEGGADKAAFTRAVRAAVTVE